MEEAVPGQQPVEAPAERQLAHVGDDPVAAGKRAAHMAIMAGEESMPVTARPASIR